MEGQIFGRYRVTHMIGAGGMAEVYAARHELMGREAAVKLISPHLLKNADILKRFFKEARAAASIRHPGIVDVFDVGETHDGRAFLVMELLHGQTLDQRLRERGTLSINEAITIIRQMTLAVGAAHEQGIIHRDLKPSNIFLTPDPESPTGERVKVLDFGLAKLTEHSASIITGNGMLLGTPAYMAPEQCRDSANVDYRADLYALGCIFYKCICGMPPFGAGGLHVLSGHLSKAPVPPSRRNPQVPPEIDAVILRLLDKVPERRYRTCAELVQALDQGKRQATAIPAVLGEVDSSKQNTLVRTRNMPATDREELSTKAVPAKLRPGSGQAPRPAQPPRPPTTACPPAVPPPWPGSGDPENTIPMGVLPPDVLSPARCAPGDHETTMPLPGVTPHALLPDPMPASDPQTTVPMRKVDRALPTPWAPGSPTMPLPVPAPAPMVLGPPPPGYQAAYQGGAPWDVDAWSRRESTESSPSIQLRGEILQKAHTALKRRPLLFGTCAAGMVAALAWALVLVKQGEDKHGQPPPDTKAIGEPADGNEHPVIMNQPVADAGLAEAVKSNDGDQAPTALPRDGSDAPKNPGGDTTGPKDIQKPGDPTDGKNNENRRSSDNGTSKKRENIRPPVSPTDTQNPPPEKRTKPLSWQELRQEALRAYQSKKYRDARPLCVEAFKLSKGAREVAWLCGLNECRLLRPDKAKGYFSRLDEDKRKHVSQVCAKTGTPIQ